jgi:hypothetical protein
LRFFPSAVGLSPPPSRDSRSVGGGGEGGSKDNAGRVIEGAGGILVNGSRAEGDMSNAASAAMKS